MKRQLIAIQDKNRDGEESESESEMGVKAKVKVISSSGSYHRFYKHKSDFGMDTSTQVKSRTVGDI